MPSECFDLIVPALLLVAMLAIGDAPSLQNAVVRLVIWWGLGAYLLRRPVMWKPGPISWFLVIFFLSWGTWTFFYVTGSLFLEETGSFLTIAGGPNANIGFQVDSGAFCFVVLAWVIVRILGPPVCFRDGNGVEIDRKPVSFFHLRRNANVTLLLMGVAGAMATIVCNYLPGPLIQPVRMFGDLFPASLAGLVLLADPRDSALNRYRLPVGLALTHGVFAFSGSGLKGALFLTLFQLAWFVGSVHRRMRFRMVIVAGVLAFLFVALLPAFQAAKDEYQRSKSRTATIDALLQRGEAGSRLTAFQSGKPYAERTWEYLGIRLCTATMTHKYFRRYSVDPRGYESLAVAINTIVPRVLDPYKLSTSEYYDLLARQSGIVSMEDRTTSCKPTFFDECIIIWGVDGFVLGGGVFGLYLAALEHFCVRVAGSGAAYVALRFTWASLGQLPYFAVVFGAAPFVLVFGAIVVAPRLLELFRTFEVQSPYVRLK